MSISLFEHGKPRLDALIKPGMLCAFDFDGTLAPIVKEPDQAQLPSQIARRLSILATYVPVAIITGRSVADVRQRLGFEPDFVIGNHGIEGLPGWEAKAQQYRQACVQWEQQLSQALRAMPEIDPHIWIENKHYSLAVHYRLAKDHVQAQAHLRQIFAQILPQAHVTDGKCVFNLLPKDAPDKGSAMQRLCQLSSAESALYVGDDVTDEDVFLQRRANWLTVRIEYLAQTAAEFHLYHRLDMIKLIDELIVRLNGAKQIGSDVA